MAPSDPTAALTAAIAALEAQRATLGDAVVEAALAPLRKKLTETTSDTPATPTQGGEHQRRYVTVLFADVSGFTAMSEAMDAEEVTAMMNALWQRMDQVILDNGGRIDKHMGDGVMALWSGDTSQEDDPERAVHAAMDMQREITHGAWQQITTLEGDFAHPRPLAIRIGIHSGLVLLGELSSRGERTIIGETVSLANAIEHAAPAGGILISHDTFRHVQGLFNLEKYGVLDLAGRSETLEVYQVTGVRPRTFRVNTRGVDGVETHLVGRDTEMRWLQQLLHDVRAGYRCRVVTIHGEAGIGKSRLLLELRNWLDELPQPVHLYLGRSSPEMQTLPYSLLRSLLSFELHIQDSDPPERVRSKIETGIAVEMALQDEKTTLWAHFIGQLAGFNFSDSPYLSGMAGDARQVRDRALSYLNEYLRLSSRGQPCVFLLEDLHWADDSSLNLVTHLVQTNLELPFLFICTARPELAERRPDWAMQLPRHENLHLKPLDPASSQQLVDEILQRVEAIPTALRQLILQHTEGNPYYVEELVNMLIDDGVIVRGESAWTIETARLTSLRVPSTLTGVLQARLDSLTSGERDTLQRASVVGRTFWDEAVYYLAQPELPAPAIRILPVREALAELSRSDMVFRQDLSKFIRVGEYTFKHTILREVAYQSVLKRQRRAYHWRAAEWLIQRSGSRAGEFAGLIADHLELAGEKERAALYLRQAAERASQRFANQEALAFLERALKLTPAGDHSHRYETLLIRERLLDLLGRREAQKADLEGLQDLAEKLDDDLKRARSTLRWAEYALYTSEFSKAVELAGLAIQQAQSVLYTCQDESLAIQAEAHFIAGRSHLRLADSPSARRHLETALNLAQTAICQADAPQIGQQMLEAHILRSLGIVAAETGDYIAARPYFEMALQRHRALGDRRGESMALNNLSLIANNLGDSLSARRFGDQALAIRREIGDLRGEAVTSNNIALILLDLGDFDEAQAYLERSLGLYRRVQDREGEDGALINLGLANLLQGRFDLARPYLDQALVIVGEINDLPGAALALANQSLLFHLIGENASARLKGQEALRLALEAEDNRAQGFAWNHLGHAALGLGDLDEARIAYQRALQIRRVAEMERLAMEPLAGLAQVALRQGDLPQASGRLDEILTYLQFTAETPIQDFSLGNALDGALEPFRVYLTLVQVMQAIGDPRASGLLQVVYELLRIRAAKLSDAQSRRIFLEKIPYHQEIERLWAATRSGRSPDSKI